MVVQFTVPDNKVTVILSVKPESFSAAIDAQSIYYFDLEGRLAGAWVDGCNYKRTLDSRLLRISRAGDRKGTGARDRHWLTPEEFREFHERMEAFMDRIHDYWVRYRAHKEDVDVRIVVDGVLTLQKNWTLEKLLNERRRFDAVYRPIGILPPDQYLALVLQLTDGCSYNDCDFCNFYRDRRFHTKNIEQFRTHMTQAREFLGRGSLMRKSIFLSEANALAISMDRLRDVFRAVHEAFDILPADLPAQERTAWRAAHPDSYDGLHAFLDVFNAERKTPDDYREMAAQDVRRIYLGVETGHDPLLQFLNKPGSADEAVDVIRAIKAGGVGAGIILMTGIGGREYAEGHVRDTIALLNRLELDRRDIIYFSAFVPDPSLPYVPKAEAAGLTPLTEDNALEQSAEIRKHLNIKNKDNSPKIAVYDIREFLY